MAQEYVLVTGGKRHRITEMMGWHQFLVLDQIITQTKQKQLEIIFVTILYLKVGL